MPELAAELIDIISDYILIDNDTPTLKAWSLSLPHLTRRFQRVLCSRRPVVLSFHPDMMKNTGERRVITKLLNILKVDPFFGGCLGEIRLYFKSMDQSLLGDPRISYILRSCTDVHTFTVKLKTGSGKWSSIPNQNRISIEQIIHLPSFKCLFLSGFVIPWARLLAPIAMLERLTLKSMDGLAEDANWLDFSANSPLAVQHSTTAIQTLQAASLPASRLVKIKSLADPTRSAIDFGTIKTFSTLCRHATNDVPLLHGVLGQLHNLENLVITCFYSTIKGIFYPPHAPSFSNIQTIEFTTKFDHVSIFALQYFSNELSFFPSNNSLKAIKLGEVGYYNIDDQSWEKQGVDWRKVFAPLVRSKFPALESLQIGIALTVVNGYWDRVKGASERVRSLEHQLSEFQETQHFRLELKFQTRHTYDW